MGGVGTWVQTTIRNQWHLMISKSKGWLARGSPSHAFHIKISVDQFEGIFAFIFLYNISVHIKCIDASGSHPKVLAIMMPLKLNNK